MRATSLGVLALLVGCGGDHDITGPVDVPGVLVTHPYPRPAGAARPGGARSAALAVELGDDSVVYASLVPETTPTGVTATVRAPRSGATVTTAVQDGGFDPVPVAAKVGDTVVTIVVDAFGAIVLHVEAAVVPIRRVKVVRTDPGPGKRDQPLNANIVIVFSDPVDPATLTASSVQVFRGTAPVAGTVSLLAGSGTTVVFSPTDPLDPNTDYRLVVTTQVQDIAGGGLDASVNVLFRTGSLSVDVANRVTVLPDTTALAVGWQGQLTAAARDSGGTSIVGRPFTWSSDNPAVATVSAGGLVTALAEGVAHVRAEMDGRAAEATIQVSVTLAPVASVEVVPGAAKVVGGGLVQLTAIVRDAAGNLLPFRAITWQSSNPAVATVAAGTGSTAVVTDVTAGSATITAISEGKSGSAAIRTGTVGPYIQLSAASAHTCALAADASAWCWGARYGAAGEFPNSGELGNGTQLGTLVPVGVAGSLAFSQVSPTCALTSDSLAYCWGSAGPGALGNGANSGSLLPVAVSGARRYSSIAVGGGHPCALTSSGAAFCWGSNGFGELGVGTTTGPESCNGAPCSTVPVPVAGGLTFTSLTEGDSHTCGLTASGFAYCWGRNDPGTLGDGTLLDRYSPVPVVGDLSFVALTAGGGHTCGLTSDGTAYCWGANDWGQLGIGTAIGPQSPCQSPIDSNRGVGNCSTVPVPVSGGQHFSAISAGGLQTCALTLAGAAYCWGWNGMGDGNLAPNSPTAVPGGLTFASLSASAGHACGVTWAGILYCWGSNFAGQLGNGSTTESGVPVKVSGQR